MFLNEVMEETRKICNSKNWPIWATPENLPFFEDEIYPLFSYSYGSKVPKWKCAHNLLCKKYKILHKTPQNSCLRAPWLNPKKKKHPVCFTYYVIICLHLHFTIHSSGCWLPTSPYVEWLHEAGDSSHSFVWQPGLVCSVLSSVWCQRWRCRDRGHKPTIGCRYLDNTEMGHLAFILEIPSHNQGCEFVNNPIHYKINAAPSPAKWWPGAGEYFIF